MNWVYENVFICLYTNAEMEHRAHFIGAAQHKQSIAFGPNKMCLWFHLHERNFRSQSNQSRDLNRRNKFPYRRKTYMCGFNWGFTTCGIEVWGFYSATCSPQSRVKQMSQTWEGVFWQSTHFYAFYVLHFWLPSIRCCVILHIVQRVIHSNIMYSRSMNVVFTEISFVIQKGLTT